MREKEDKCDPDSLGLSNQENENAIYWDKGDGKRAGLTKDIKVLELHVLSVRSY